jgi:AcrR family transcriptional regulator
MPRTAQLDPPAALQTRQRLLQAAGEVFAEHGFRAARVRDICERAGANIASINYYFGDKASLYSDVLEFAAHHLIAKHPLDAGLPPAATPRQRLEVFVRAFLGRIFENGRLAWHGKLMAREMLEPSTALDKLVRGTIRPQAQVLNVIVRDLGEGKLDEQQVRRCAQSIMGQCLLYRHARSLLVLLDPRERYGPPDIARLSEHILRFSLAGIRELLRGHGAQAN